MFGNKKVLERLDEIESRCNDRYEYLLDEVEGLKAQIMLLRNETRLTRDLEKIREKWEKKEEIEKKKRGRSRKIKPIVEEKLEEPKVYKTKARDKPKG